MKFIQNLTNKSILSFIFFSAILLLGSCRKIKGDGPIVSETRIISDFSKVRLAMSEDVIIIPDATFKVELVGQKNILDVIKTNTYGSELKIDVKQGVRLGHHDPVKIYVHCPNIDGLAISGSGKILCLDSLNVSNVNLDISGSGDIELMYLSANSVQSNISGSGTIQLQKGILYSIQSRISGSGNFNALGVATKEVGIKISGSGDARFQVSDALDVNISGSGDVYYLGTPRINQSISGSGKVIRL